MERRTQPTTRRAAEAARAAEQQSEPPLGAADATDHQTRRRGGAGSRAAERAAAWSGGRNRPPTAPPRRRDRACRRMERRTPSTSTGVANRAARAAERSSGDAAAHSGGCGYGAGYELMPTTRTALRGSGVARPSRRRPAPPTRASALIEPPPPSPSPPPPSDLRTYRVARGEWPSRLVRPILWSGPLNATPCELWFDVTACGSATTTAMVDNATVRRGVQTSCSTHAQHTPLQFTLAARSPSRECSSRRDRRYAKSRLPARYTHKDAMGEDAMENRIQWWSDMGNG